MLSFLDTSFEWYNSVLGKVMWYFFGSKRNRTLAQKLYEAALVYALVLIMQFICRLTKFQVELDLALFPLETGKPKY